MANTRNQIVVSLIGDTKRLNSSLSDAQKRVQLFGVAATAALVAFGAKSAKAYQDRAMAQEKLNFSLSKSPKLYQLSASSLATYNNAMAKTTAIDDDVIAGAEAILARYAQNEEQLKSLTSLTLDYSRVTGQSVDASAGTIGKALLGNTRALKALGIAYTSTGDAAKDAANIQQLLNEKIGGYAEKYAKTAAGRAEELNRQWGELQESIGQGVLPVLTQVNNVLGATVGVVNDLPGPMKQGVYMTALFGATALAAGPRIMVMKTALDEAGWSAANLRAKLSLAKVATTSFKAVGIMALLTALEQASESFMRGRNAVDAWTTAVQDGTGSSVAAALDQNLNQLPNVWERVFSVKMGGTSNPLDNFNGTIQTAKESLTDLGFTYGDVNKALQAGQGGWDTFIASIKDQAKSTGMATQNEDWLIAALADVKEAHDRGADAADSNAKSTGGYADVTSDAAKQAKALTGQIQKLLDKFTILRQGTLDVRAAHRAWQQALLDATQAVKDNGKTLDSNTDAGLKNADALDAVTTAANDDVVALAQHHHSIQEVTSAYKEHRAELVRVAQQFGMSKAKAKAYVDQVLKTPKKVTTQIQLLGMDEAIQKWMSLYSWMSRSEAKLYAQSGGVPSAVSHSGGHARGGFITGPGTTTSDSIPARLSRGEYVMSAAAVRTYGRSTMDRMNARRFASGGSVDTAKAQDQKRDQRVLDSLDKVISHLEDVLSKATERLDAVQKKMADTVNSFRSSATGYGQLSSIQAPEGMRLDANSLQAGVHAQLAKVRRFMGLLKKLVHLGLGRSTVMQIIGMGPEQGMEYAQVLAAGGLSLIRDINGMESGIARAGAKAGRYASRDWYGDDLARARRRVARADARVDAAKAVRREIVKDQVNIHLEVHGSVLTERQLRDVLQDAIARYDKRNGKRRSA